jgi:Domain of unknown function (DUF6895)
MYARSVLARADLNTFASGAIGWVDDHRARFDPDAAPLQAHVGADKALVELAVMTRRLQRSPLSPDSMARINGFVNDMLGRPRYQHRNFRSRAEIVAAAFVLAAADQAHDTSQSLRARLQATIDIGVLDALERPVHRVMEERLALEWAGLHHSLPSWQRLTNDSLLGAGPNAVFLGRAAAYQLTHAVLYVAGFGSRTPVCSLHRIAELRRRLATLIVRFRIQEHWDLVAELLLSWACLGLGPSGVCEAAWRALLDQVAPDGSIHAVAEDPGTTGGSEERFRARYHTTLVGIMAAETWLRSCSEGSPGEEGGGTAGRVHPQAWARKVADVEAGRLASLVDEGAHQDARTVCGALVGVWICAAVSPAAKELLVRIAPSVALALDGDHAWTDTPAAWAFVTYGVLAGRGRAPEGLDAYVRAAARALKSSRPEDLSLAEARWLLHRLGRVRAPDLAPVAAVSEAATEAALAPTEANCERLVLTVESRTAFGALASSGPAWVSELLLGFAVHHARSEDLVSTGRATRAAVHLGGVSTDAAYELARYMASQQQPGGGFRPTSTGREAVGACEEPPASSLNVSLSVLWTLAEATTAWRLPTAL